MEASNELAEEVLVELPSRYGCVVSATFPPSCMSEEYGLMPYSAGIAAAVKTSKVPITVKAASSDITCKYLCYQRGTACTLTYL